MINYFRKTQNVFSNPFANGCGHVQAACGAKNLVNGIPVSMACAPKLRDMCIRSLNRQSALRANKDNNLTLAYW
jgi:hypothetical protein